MPHDNQGKSREDMDMSAWIGGQNLTLQNSNSTALGALPTTLIRQPSERPGIYSGTFSASKPQWPGPEKH